ncbi:MAG: SDR family NAD(P)-dependent oxidoreductase [Gemmatimonadales bacterium]
MGGPIEFLPVDEVRRQFEVNVFGLLAVTQAFLPLFRAARGRIVNMGSIAGKSVSPFVGPYCMSKHAVEALTDALRLELADAGIQVSVIEPGAVKTPIWSKGASEFARIDQILPPTALDRYGAKLAFFAKVLEANDRRGVPAGAGGGCGRGRARKPGTPNPLSRRDRREGPGVDLPLAPRSRGGCLSPDHAAPDATTDAMMPNLPLLMALAGGLLTGCLDPEPTAPDGTPFGMPDLVPARAWLETGGVLQLSVEPAGPFGLRAGGHLAVAGATVSAVSVGTDMVEALFATGRREAEVTVVSPRATLTPAVLNAGLTDQSLLGVWTADESTFFAVGGSGTVIITRDGGTTWRRMNSRTDATLTAVWGSSASDVYAVGSSGVLIHYDGASWEQVALGTEQALLGVWGIDRNHVYVVGAGVAFRFDGQRWNAMPGAAGAELWAVWGTGPDLLYSSGQNGILMRWDGTAWRPMTSPTNYVLFGLWGTAADDVFAAGIRGTVLHYDGTSWTPVTVPSTADFFDIIGRARNDMVVVGNDGSVISFNGTSWTQAPQKATKENLRGVRFTPSGRAIVVGWSGTVIERSSRGWRALLTAPILEGSAPGTDGDLHLVGLGGSMYRYWGGVLTPEVRLVRQDLYGIAQGRRHGDLIAVGDSGTILTRRADAWEEETVQPRVLVRSVWADANDPDAVFAVGDQGTVFRRQGALDGGDNADAGVPPPGLASGPVDVFAVGDSGVILRWEGRSLEPDADAGDEPYRAVGSGPDDVFAVGERAWHSGSTAAAGTACRPRSATGRSARSSASA